MTSDSDRRTTHTCWLEPDRPRARHRGPAPAASRRSRRTPPPRVPRGGGTGRTARAGPRSSGAPAPSTSVASRAWRIGNLLEPGDDDELPARQLRVAEAGVGLRRGAGRKLGKVPPHPWPAAWLPGIPARPRRRSAAPRRPIRPSRGLGAENRPARNACTAFLERAPLPQDPRPGGGAQNGSERTPRRFPRCQSGETERRPGAAWAGFESDLPASGPPRTSWDTADLRPGCCPWPAAPAPGAAGGLVRT